MKKLLTFNHFLSSRLVAKHGQRLKVNNFTKYERILTNNMAFSSVQRVLSNSTLHGSQVVAFLKLEQENNHFYHKNCIFLNFLPLGHPEDSNIFEKFFSSF